MSEHFIAAILSGDMDHHLDEIHDTLKFRRSTIATQKRADLRKGDIVRFNERIHPKYLVNLTGEVERVLTKRVEVRITDPRARRFIGLTRVPVDFVNKIETDRDRRAEDREGAVLKPIA